MPVDTTTKRKESQIKPTHPLPRVQVTPGGIPPVKEEVKVFPIQTLSELLDGETRIDWIVDGIIPPHTAGILAGDSGVGKTWLMLDLAIAIASGTPWLGQFDVRQGTVLIVDEENAELLLRVRMLMLLKGRGLDAKNVPIHFAIGNAVDLAPVKGKRGEPIMSESTRRLGKTINKIKPRLVMFDSLVRVNSAKENDSTEMSKVFSVVKGLMDRTGIACIFAHHTRKGRSQSGQDIRGSGDIRAFADYTLIASKGKDKTINVLHDKSRWSEPVNPFVVSLVRQEESLSLVFDGQVKEKQDEYEFVIEQLSSGDKTRQELVDLVTDNKICSTRNLDRLVGKMVDNGKVSKTRLGRKVMFSLEYEHLSGEELLPWLPQVDVCQ